MISYKELLRKDCLTKPLHSYILSPLAIRLTKFDDALSSIPGMRLRLAQRHTIFAASIFLVCVPVFFQAPLVRLLPWVSLFATGIWLFAGFKLASVPKNAHWGSLLIGFSWTWLAGSIYWGWLRWEPLLHLPVESIGLPFALLSLAKRKWIIGSLFYLGSLLGTAVTDLYFYIVDLIPHWRQLMQADPVVASQTLHNAIAQIQTSWGISWVTLLIGVLLVSGLVPLRYQKLHCWAFSGAVLSTILVDGLFWLAALAA